MTKKVLALVLFGLLTGFGTSAAYAQKDGIELKSVAEVEQPVKNEKGEVELKRVEAALAKVLPSDAVIFTTYYANGGAKAAEDVVISNPVPEHTLYVAGSVEGAGAKVEFSVDGGKRFDLPENLRVKGPEGRERPAAASDYTNIRWTLRAPVKPGDKGSVSFRAKVK